MKHNIPNRMYGAAKRYGGGTNCVFLMAGQENVIEPNNNTFIESSKSRHTVTLNGDTNRDLSQFKVDGGSWSSMNGNGNGDYYQAPTHADFTFVVSEDFTFDGWLWVDSTQPSTASWGVFTTSLYNAGGGICCVCNASFIIQVWRGATIMASNAAVPLDTWFHLAVLRFGGSSWRMAIDGILQTSTYSSNTAISCPNYLRVLGREFSAARSLKARMDSFRITKGQAPWSANFGGSLPLLRSDYEG